MKKIFAFLCAAALVGFVSCEPEEEKNPGGSSAGSPTEEPTDSIKFNRYSAIKVPIEENGKKSGAKYDATVIYENASWMWFRSIHPEATPYNYNLLKICGALYYQFRDTVEKEIAIRDDYALHVPDGITPEAPGAWVYMRDIVLMVSLDGDGNLFEVSKYKDEDFLSYPPNARVLEHDSVINLDYFDTVAYIPNAIMDSMQPLMEKAFEEQDWAKTFEMFENSYKFIPITGAEYQELAREGRQ